jgi:glycosyltransferase involved in cell wall biosynthesis
MYEGGLVQGPAVATQTPASLVVLGYPYLPSATTGRGIDRYLYYLTDGLERRRVAFRSVENGQFATHLRQLVWGEPDITARIGRVRGGLWHAASPVGGRIAGLLGRAPLVTTIHDVVPFRLLRLHPARYRFLRFCIRVSCARSTRLISPFEFTRRYLVDRLGVPERKTCVVPLGVDPSTLQAGATSEPLFGANPQRRVLFLGSWNPIERGGDLAVRAWTQVHRTLPDAQLFVSGTGAGIERLRALASELGISERVRFIGFIPEGRLGDAFRSVSAFLYPSRIGFSLSVMQAMHAGVPVVVSSSLDMGEFVGAGGLVCPEENPDALAAEVVRLLEDRPLQVELAQRGTERIRQFPLDAMVDGTLAVYHQLGLA